MTGVRYVLHVVVAGGAVADVVYVGAFRDYDRAVEIAERIERVADREDFDVAAKVRELLPGSTSAARIVEEALR